MATGNRRQGVRARGIESSVTTRKDDLVEVLHGVPVPDPYRWLEDGESPEVRAWDETQNALTRAWLEPLAGQDALRARARELLSVGYVGRAGRAEDVGWRLRRYFHVRREGAQEQATLYVRDGADGAETACSSIRLLCRPMARPRIDWWVPSADGALVAWGVSEAGSEESTLRIRDVATGQDLPDRIPQTRHASVAWLPDGQTLFYTRYPAPGEVPPGDEKYFCRVYLHRLGRRPEARRARLRRGARQARRARPCSSRREAGGSSCACTWAGRRARSGCWTWRRRRRPGCRSRRASEALYEPVPLDDVLYRMSNEVAPRYRLFEVTYADARARTVEARSCPRARTS